LNIDSYDKLQQILIYISNTKNSWKEDNYAIESSY
jgi:hypothetical protein